jgi:hypothetical protein
VFQRPCQLPGAHGRVVCTKQDHTSRSTNEPRRTKTQTYPQQRPVAIGVWHNICSGHSLEVICTVQITRLLAVVLLHW